MPNCPFISIIIPVKNEAALIGKCLQGLKRLNYPKDRFEVIISDGLSADRTAEIARSYGAKVIENKKQTVAPGRNVGFLNSSGDLVAFSDADCLVDENWLKEAIKYFKDAKVAGIGGPSLAPENESSFGRAVRFLFLLGSLISGSVYVTDLKKIKTVKSVPGCNAIYKREALNKVMPIDETLLTCDDVEMNYQLRSGGYKVLYVPDVIVWHYRRDNPKKFWKQIYKYAIGRLQLGKKHRSEINFIHIISGLAIPIFILSLIVSFILNPVYPLFLISVSLIVILFPAILNLAQKKSKKEALDVFLATLIFIFAWSVGFLRELFFPIKKTAGK